MISLESFCSLVTRSQIDLQARIFENNRFVYELEYVIGTQWVDPFLIKGTVAKSK